MDPSAGLRFLSDVVKTQRKQYVAHVSLTVGLVAAGVLLIAFGSLLTGVLLADYWKWLLTLGGTFVASLSSVRLGDLFGMKARLLALAQLQADFTRAATPLADVPPEDLARLRDRVEKLFDKALGI